MQKRPFSFIEKYYLCGVGNRDRVSVVLKKKSRPSSFTTSLAVSRWKGEDNTEHTRRIYSLYDTTHIRIQYETNTQKYITKSHDIAPNVFY